MSINGCIVDFHMEPAVKVTAGAQQWGREVNLSAPRLWIVHTALLYLWMSMALTPASWVENP